MARRKKNKPYRTYLKIFFGLVAIFTTVYFLVHLFIIKPNIIYPGFEVPIPAGYEIHGIDVSRYQETINWLEVKNMEVKGFRLGFVFMKATEGKSLVDNQFRRNWLQAEKYKIPKGAYHFFVPGSNAKAQVKNFIQIVNLKRGDLPPVLDVEKSRNLSIAEMREEVKLCLTELENHYGVKPIIYTNIHFYKKYFEEGFEKYPVWIAHYLQPDKPRMDSDWIFWQHSESGRVNGIKSMVDFNVFNGDSSDFKKLLIQ